MILLSKIDPYTGARTGWFTQDHPQQAWQAREALLIAHYPGAIGNNIRNPDIVTALQACPQKQLITFLIAVIYIAYNAQPLNELMPDLRRYLQI